MVLKGPEESWATREQHLSLLTCPILQKHLQDTVGRGGKEGRGEWRSNSQESYSALLETKKEKPKAKKLKQWAKRSKCLLQMPANSTLQLRGSLFKGRLSSCRIHRLPRPNSDPVTRKASAYKKGVCI